MWKKNWMSEIMTAQTQRVTGESRNIAKVMADREFKESSEGDKIGREQIVVIKQSWIICQSRKSSLDEITYEMALKEVQDNFTQLTEIQPSAKMTIDTLLLKGQGNSAA